MTTDAEFVILLKPKEHSHDSCEGSNVANMLIDGMRKRSRESTTHVPQIYEQERKKMITDDYCIKPSDIALNLKMFIGLSTQLCRQRSKTYTHPTIGLFFGGYIVTCMVLCF